MCGAYGHWEFSDESETDEDIRNRTQRHEQLEDSLRRAPISIEEQPEDVAGAGAILLAGG